MTSVYADLGRPRSIFEMNSIGARVFYNYKLVGRTQYYIEFGIDKHGSSDPKQWVVTGVQHTSKPT